MRVAMFASNYPPHPGGLEIAVRSLASQLAANHEVTVVTTAWHGNAGASREHGVQVIRVPVFHATERAGVPYPLPLGPGVRKAMRQAAGADVVHAHGALYPTTILAARCASKWSVPLVVTEHVGFVTYRSRVLNSIQSVAWNQVGDRIVRRSAAVVSYNSRVGDWLRDRYGRERIRHIGNGVDTDRFRPPLPDERQRARLELGLPEHEPLVLFVGRETEKKNLRAVLGMKRRGWKLVVCGAQRRRGGDGIIDLGVLPHERMALLLAAVDLMVTPSCGEGFPLAVQEAFASGVPVVLLWDPGYQPSLDRCVPVTVDRVEEIPAAISAVLADSCLRTQIGQRERAWAVRNWRWTATAERYDELYRTVIGD